MDPGHLREMLSTLRSPEALEVTLDEMFGLSDEPDRLEKTSVLSEQLLTIARRPGEIAVARFLAAVVAERRCNPLGAEAHLHLAVEADPRWAPGVDRLAWYLSDRGDARGAAQLWRQLEGEDNYDLAEIEPFAEVEGPKLGRNDPCWCGSGRKFKACHLGSPPLPPLPDRVGWLCRKTIAYLERRGGAPTRDVFTLASARAGGDANVDKLSDAFADPFVFDIALHELGWFERFLTERGALLPEDEALLAASWTLVARNVYEVAEIEPGLGLVISDLRTGETLKVRERTFSRSARVGSMVCARAVPDGETHQFIGGLFSVAPGTEAHLLDLLDQADGFALIQYLGELEKPPKMFTREGEPMVMCAAVVQVPEEAAARVLLDRNYESEEDDAWAEMHPLDEVESLLRASIHLDGRNIRVETSSEPRLERVLSVLLQIDGAKMISDERHPFEFDPKAQPKTPRPALPEDPVAQAVVEAMRDRQEIAWVDHPVPALAGLTPREAAADPTRRESLVRLLASFEETGERKDLSGFIGMRSERLRELLGLGDQ